MPVMEPHLVRVRDTETQEALPSGQSSPSVVTCQCQDSEASRLHGAGSALGVLSRASACTSPPLAGLHLRPFPASSRGCEGDNSRGSYEPSGERASLRVGLGTPKLAAE